MWSGIDVDACGAFGVPVGCRGFREGEVEEVLRNGVAEGGWTGGRGGAV